MPQARGKILIGLIRFLRATAPENGLERVLANCPVAAPVYASKVNPVLWYPIENFLDPLQAAIDLFYGGSSDGFIAFGDWAAHYDFHKHYSFLAGANMEPTDIIKSADLVWPDNYQDAGITRTAVQGESRCRTEIDFPEMRHAHCLLMRGWSNRFAQLALPSYDIGTRLESCRHTGAETAVYLSEWNRKDQRAETPSQRAPLTDPARAPGWK